MRFIDHNIGPHRWHIDVYPNRRDDDMDEFLFWMKENHPECMCKGRSGYFGIAYYELRGTGLSAITEIKLTWG